MTPEHIGLAGGVVGILGGITGTWFSIRNTTTTAERRFAWRVSICIWLWLGLFLAALHLTPAQWNWIPWVPQGVAFPFVIRYLNRRSQALRGPERDA